MPFLQQGVVLPQVHGRHRHPRRQRQRRVRPQQRLHCLRAQRLPLVQQLRQRLLDPRLPLQRGPLQQPQVLPVRTPGLLRHQGVVRPPVGHRRVQVFPVHVARERPGLAHQPVDHVPVVNVVLGLAAQPLHRLHPLLRVPHLDGLGANPYLDLRADQSRRHRVGVALHLDRAPPADPRLVPFQRLQPPGRQRSQLPAFLQELLLPPRVPPGHHGQHELPVRLPADEVPAAAEEQFLRHRLLETPVALLAVAILVGAIRVGRLGRDAVMSQQRPVVLRVRLRVAVVVHGQRHAVGPVPRRRRAQRPPGVLRPFAQAGEALREAQADVLPVRVRQDEVVHQMRKRLALDRHPQRLHVREVRRPQPARLMHLGEEDFAGWPVLGTPLPHAPLQGPPALPPVRSRAFALEPFQQRLGLETRLPFEQFRQTGPDRCQRVRPRPMTARRPQFAGQPVGVAVLPCRLAIHACLQRRPLQRRPSLELFA
jgi:hypothetical protein